MTPGPPARSGLDGHTLLGDLVERPWEFGFDAAVAVLLRATGRSDPGQAIRFEVPAGLAFPPSDVLDVERRDDGTYRLVTTLIGLTGPAGALPRCYTEHVITERRGRSRVLADFLDMLAQRSIAQFAAAVIKYHPHRIAEAAIVDRSREDGLRAMLVALSGYAIPVVSRALGDSLDTVLHHAGAFAAHPRSADRLSAILSDWLGHPVVVEQFAGRWVRLDPTECSALPVAGGIGRFSRLGIDVAIGAACWDIQSTITIRIGPLPLEEFDALLPGMPVLDALVTLTRAYLDGAADFRINPVLAAAAVPPLAFGGQGGACKLGWNTWLGTAAPRTRDGIEAVFHPGARRGSDGVR